MRRLFSQLSISQFLSDIKEWFTTNTVVKSCMASLVLFWGLHSFAALTKLTISDSPISEPSPPQVREEQESTPKPGWWKLVW